jgi:serine/threonine-protein kinase RsbW
VTSTCEITTLTIPARSTYVPVASSYVQAVASHFGFDDGEGRQLADAFSLLLKDLLDHAFEPNNTEEVHISCERIPMGLKTVIREKGLPLAPDELPTLAASRHSGFPLRLGEHLTYVQDAWDEAFFQNLGPAGAAVQLVKYSTGSRVEPVSGPTPAAPPQPIPGPGEPESFQVRPFIPADAQAVVRLFYRTYGYSYPHEYLYYPERLTALNTEGSLRSLIAVSHEGELAGHIALFLSPDHPSLAEIGAAVVNPDSRGHSCLLQLTEHALAEARQCQLQALFGQAVTNHTYSQKVAESFQFTPCGLLVGYGPASLTFKKIHEDLPQRESLLLLYRGLIPISPIAIYAPARHEEWIRKIYAGLGMKPAILTPPGDLQGNLPGQGHIELSTYQTTGTATIRVKSIGQETPEDIRHALKHLCQARFEVIQLNIDLGQPGAPELISRCEPLGFFVGGILPGLNDAQTMILQYLNNVPIDYDQIQLYSPLAQEILTYVKGLDPNRL